MVIYVYCKLLIKQKKTKDFLYILYDSFHDDDLTIIPHHSLGTKSLRVSMPATKWAIKFQLPNQIPASNGANPEVTFRKLY